MIYKNRASDVLLLLLLFLSIHHGLLNFTGEHIFILSLFLFTCVCIWHSRQNVIEIGRSEQFVFIKQIIVDIVTLQKMISEKITLQANVNQTSKCVNYAFVKCECRQIFFIIKRPKEANYTITANKAQFIRAKDASKYKSQQANIFLFYTRI